MTKTIRFLLKAACPLVLAFFLAACGNTDTYSSIEPGQESARSRANLELPPDLSTTSSDALAANQAAAEARSEEVLPEPEGLDVKRNDAEGWLEVDAPADQVWRRLIAHWGALGVDLVVSNPGEGIMETDWVKPATAEKEESHLGQVLVDQFLGKLFDENTALDKYTLTLQRLDENRTRIDVAHRGIKKIQTQRSSVGTNADWDWVETEEDPAKIKRALSSIVYGLRGGTT
jgi:outer membrane protein assembly factor BamC